MCWRCWRSQDYVRIRSSRISRAFSPVATLRSSTSPSARPGDHVEAAPAETDGTLTQLGTDTSVPSEKTLTNQAHALSAVPTVPKRGLARVSSCPDDDFHPGRGHKLPVTILAAVTKLPVEIWQDRYRRVVDPFFDVRDGHWFHNRIERELLGGLLGHNPVLSFSTVVTCMRAGLYQTKNGLLVFLGSLRSRKSMTLAEISSSTPFERSRVSGPWSWQVWFFAVSSEDLHQMTGRGGVRQVLVFVVVCGSTAPGTSGRPGIGGDGAAQFSQARAPSEVQQLLEPRSSASVTL